MNNSGSRVLGILVVLSVAVVGLSPIVTGADSAQAAEPAAEKPKPEFPPLEKLRQIKQSKMDPILETDFENLDPYTRAYLRDASIQVKRALEAHYVFRQLWLIKAQNSLRTDRAERKRT